MYANKQVSSESLHYSTVMFPNRAGSGVKGTSSLTAEYATVNHGSKQQNEGRKIEGITETKERDKEQLEHSDEVLYSQIKPHKREQKV